MEEEIVMGRNIPVENKMNISTSTKVGGSAPTGGCTHNELKIGEDEGFRLVTNVSDQLEGGGESGARRSDTLSLINYNSDIMLVTCFIIIYIKLNI